MPTDDDLQQAIDLAMNEEPTTAEEWAERETEEGAIIIRSDVRQAKNGRWEYLLWHPASGRRQRGQADSSAQAYEAMEIVTKDWFGQDAKGTTTIRLHDD